MIVSGANLSLQPTDVSRAEQLFSKAAVVVCQLEVPPETSLAALIAGRKHGGVFVHVCVCVSVCVCMGRGGYYSVGMKKTAYLSLCVLGGEGLC